MLQRRRWYRHSVSYHSAAMITDHYSYASVTLRNDITGCAYRFRSLQSRYARSAITRKKRSVRHSTTQTRGSQRLEIYSGRGSGYMAPNERFLPFAHLQISATNFHTRDGQGGRLLPWMHTCWMSLMLQPQPLLDRWLQRQLCVNVPLKG